MHLPRSQAVSISHYNELKRCSKNCSWMLVVTELLNVAIIINNILMLRHYVLVVAELVLGRTQCT